MSVKYSIEGNLLVSREQAYALRQLCEIPNVEILKLIDTNWDCWDGSKDNTSLYSCLGTLEKSHVIAAAITGHFIVEKTIETVLEDRVRTYRKAMDYKTAQVLQKLMDDLKRYKLI